MNQFRNFGRGERSSVSKQTFNVSSYRKRGVKEEAESAKCIAEINAALFDHRDGREAIDDALRFAVTHSEHRGSLAKGQQSIKVLHAG